MCAHKSNSWQDDKPSTYELEFPLGVEDELASSVSGQVIRSCSTFNVTYPRTNLTLGGCESRLRHCVGNSFSLSEQFTLFLNCLSFNRTVVCRTVSMPRRHATSVRVNTVRLSE